jgi:hypothetical protein
MLPHVPYDEATIGVFLKWRLEYKSPHMSRNVCLNLIILMFKDLIFNTIIFKFKCYHGPSMEQFIFYVYNLV